MTKGHYLKEIDDQWQLLDGQPSNDLHTRTKPTPSGDETDTIACYHSKSINSRKNNDDNIAMCKPAPPKEVNDLTLNIRSAANVKGWPRGRLKAHRQCQAQGKLGGRMEKHMF